MKNRSLNRKVIIFIVKCHYTRTDFAFYRSQFNWQSLSFLMVLVLSVAIRAE